MLWGIRLVPIFEGDLDVVKEVPVGSRDRPEWEADDAEKVEVEDGDVSSVRICHQRPGLTATIVDGVQSMEHFQCLQALEVSAFGPGDELLDCKSSVSLHSTTCCAPLKRTVQLVITARVTNLPFVLCQGGIFAFIEHVFRLCFASNRPSSKRPSSSSSDES